MADLINLAFLAFVIGITTFAMGCHKLREAQAATADARRKLADCEEARRELQKFGQRRNARN